MIYQQIPEEGMESEQILQLLDKRIQADVDPTKGQTFAYVY